jgi:hypothetical protein
VIDQNSVKRLRRYESVLMRIDKNRELLKIKRPY